MARIKEYEKEKEEEELLDTIFKFKNLAQINEQYGKVVFNNTEELARSGSPFSDRKT